MIYGIWQLDGDILNIQWLHKKQYANYPNSAASNCFSITEFALSYNQLFFVSCIGYDISGDGDGNPTYENGFNRVCLYSTTNAMLFILCI